MINGYVFLYRKSLDSPVWADEHLWRLWSWCLLRANHKKASVSVTTGRGKTVVTLDPGQFIVGRKTGADDLGWKKSTFRDRLSRLELMGNIDIKPGTHFSTVTICNWGDYQSVNGTKPTTKRQPTDTDKNVKNKNKRPSVDEVEEYCKERGNTINAQSFIDHYETVGWVYGKNKQPVKSWKACVRTWENRRKTEGGQSNFLDNMQDFGSGQ